MKSRTMLALGTVLVAAAMASANAKTLYEKYGIHKIAAAVYATVDAHAGNKTLLMNDRFRATIEPFPRPAIQFAVTNWVAKNLGGPQKLGNVNPGSIAKYFNFTGMELMEFKRVIAMECEEAGIERADAQRIADMNVQWIAKSKTIVELPRGEMLMKPDSLYAKLGGIVPIALVVDEFVNRLGRDPTITGNPNVVKSLTEGNITITGIKYLVTEQLAAAAGGPYKYTGRSMKKSHKELNINEQEWQAGAAILKGVLDDFKVPAGLQLQVIAIIQSTKKDIVKGG